MMNNGFKLLRSDLSQDGSDSGFFWLVIGKIGNFACCYQLNRIEL